MTSPRHEDYAIIVNDQRHVLLVDGALPGVASSDGHFWQTCEPVNRAMRKTYGIEATTVRCLQTQFTPELITNVYLMEYQGQRAPASGQWIAPAQLPRLRTPATAKAVRGWLDWFVSDHPQRRDWYRPGFFRTASESLQARLPNIRIRRVEQVRAWERSSVFRILTDDDDDLYLKSIPPMFAHEPALSAWLSARYPAQFPAVRDYRPGCDVITAAYSGKTLMEMPDLELWAAALRQYARLQVALTDHIDGLRALGVPERGLDWIAGYMDDLLDDDALLRCGIRPLADDQIERLRGLKSRLHAACDHLRGFHIPSSLEHGDLWTGQVIVQPGGGFLFTDWSDSAITYPLFSLPFFLAEVDNELPGVRDARERLAEAYLTPWTDFEPMPRLLEAYESVRLLSPLYTALQYAFDILPSMEIRWEMENMVAYNLRLLLREAA